jgi:hypothetical protein
MAEEPCRLATNAESAGAPVVPLSAHRAVRGQPFAVPMIDYAVGEICADLRGWATQRKSASAFAVALLAGRAGQLGGF